MLQDFPKSSGSKAMPRIEVVGSRSGVVASIIRAQWAIICEPQQISGSIPGTTGFMA